MSHVKEVVAQPSPPVTVYPLTAEVPEVVGAAHDTRTTEATCTAVMSCGAPGKTTARTAALASTIPVPQIDVEHVEPVGNARVVANSLLRRSARLNVGCNDNTNAATAATCGDAIDVPDIHA